jgi:PAS domain S-box-containing protein
MIKFRTSPSVLSLIASLSTALFFTVIVLYYVTENTRTGFGLRMSLQEKRYTENQQALVKSEVERIIKRIDRFRDVRLREKKKNLAEKVKRAAEFINLSLELSEDGSLSKSNYQELFNSLIGMEDDNCFCVLDSSGNIIYHGENSSLIGRNVKELISLESLENMTETVLANGSGFGEYKWFADDKEKKRTVSKMSYAEKLKNYDLYVVSGFDVDEFEKSLKADAVSFIRNERFGKDETDYFWINDLDYTGILLPMITELEGKNLKGMRSRDGVYIFMEINKIVQNDRSGFLEYYWPKTPDGEPERKMSYVTFYEPWGWIIGSGFYFSGLTGYYDDEKKLLDKLVSEDMTELRKVVLLIFAIVIASGLFISRKIYQLEKKQEEHRSLLEQYKDILDMTSVVSITDKLGYMTYVNDKFCEISGYGREELLGNRHNLIKHSSTPIETFQELWNTITKGDVWKGVLRNRRKDGESFYISTTIAPFKDETGEIIEFIACANDITELIENRNKIEEIFNSDSLTGLGSRLKLLNDAESMNAPALAIIDIRGFKQINEIYGNHFADRILVDMAKELIKFPALAGFSVYRIHSDKFGILGNDLDLAEFKNKVLTCVKRLTKTFHSVHGEEKVILFTVGIASDKNNLVAYADMALQGAKKLKQDCLVYSQADNRVMQDFEKNLNIISKVADALKNDRVIAYFQPIIDLKTNIITKYECLMRVVDEGGDIISPGVFLDISKKTNMYPKLTAKVIEKSIAVFKKLSYDFSINLSVEDIFDRDTMDYMFTVAKNNDVMDRMVIEIVESEELVNIEETNRIFERFKAAGVKISIDDFGTGFSNFDYLMNIRADYLKIDASIVKRVREDESSKEVILSIVSLAKHANMKTVAEFIFDETIAKEVAALGVDYGQGYFFGKPLEHPL